MSKSDVFENDILKLIFQGVAIANLADNASAAPLANLSVALHIGDPGENGLQNTNEATYAGYARQSVPRSAGGWTVNANSVSPAANITFNVCSGGSNTITHFSIGPTGGGSTKIFFTGPVTPNIPVSAGISPQLTTLTTIVED